MKWLLGLLFPVVAFSAPNPNDVIKGVSWFGFEVERANLMCLWQNDISWNLRKIESVGFNTIRLPFSYDFIKANNWVDMDSFFNEILKTNLSVVLDYHRIENSHQSPVPWIDGKVTFDDFLASWDTILSRYGNHERLIGVDVFNEFQSDDAAQWSNIARQIVSYIDQHHGHNDLIYYVQGYSWAGNTHELNLEGMLWSDKVVYVAHKYAFSTTEPYEHDWDWSIRNHPAEKINIGEWGFITDHPNEVAWAERFVDWLREKGIRSTFFWCWSWNSYDTGGILLTDCTSVDCRKLKLLHRLWS